MTIPVLLPRRKIIAGGSGKDNLDTMRQDLPPKMAEDVIRTVEY